MVEITIIIEGGTVNTDASDVSTVDNSQALRQSINRIFSEILNENVSIIIQMGAGYRNAASQFVRNTKSGVFLYVDLDDREDNIPNWFRKLETENPLRPINIPDLKKADVFFMIQEMESWILKQPEAIDRWGNTNGYLRAYSTDAIHNHPLIFNKDIESINKPSRVLYQLIKHFFKREYKGKGKKVQYGKLKTAPGLLDALDVSQLLLNDAELQRFRQTLI